jgi:DNA-3-methyladenine glycosylase I
MKAMAGVGVPAQLPTVVRADDGVTRCRWATETGRDLTAYHDDEWGTPTQDEAALFEALALTYFENGLSWATVFDKRDNLRKAFGAIDGRYLYHSQSAKDRGHAAQRSSAVEILVVATSVAVSTA